MEYLVHSMGSYVITNGLVITMDDRNRIIRGGCVVVEDGVIVDVGKARDLAEKYDYEKIDAGGNIIMPGLINTHTHLFQELGKNLCVDVDLQRWFRSVWAPLVSNMSIEDYVNAVRLGVLEAIRSGTTTIVAYEHALNAFEGDIDKVVSAIKGSKIRCIFGYGYQDTGEEIGAPRIALKSLDYIYKRLKEFFSRQKQDDMFRVWLAPGTINWCTKELLSLTKELADKYNTGITVHMNETKAEKEYSIKKRGGSEVEYAYSVGFLGPNVLGVHLVWTDSREIEILARTNTKVSHNPISNMYLASGIAPIPEMLRKNIIVGLATDGAASNNNMDMFDVIRITPLLHKVVHGDPTALSALDTLRMATIMGAKAIMMEEKIGSLEKGKYADIIIVDIHKPNTTPIYDPIATLVYSASSCNVDTVIINGKIMMMNRKLTYMDEEKIIENAQKSLQRITDRMNKQ